MVSDRNCRSLTVPPPSPSEDELRAPTDMADSFDFRDGDIASELFVDGDGDSKPALDTADPVVEFECFCCCSCC